MSQTVEQEGLLIDQSVLGRFGGKEVRVTTEDGYVFEGLAEAYPSGYGLHVFDREEESLEIGGTHIFKSEIKSIEALGAEASRAAESASFEKLSELMGDLLEGPYVIADVLPKQVPRDAPGQYFAVERYWLKPERLETLRRKFAGILLRLNCYYDMVVSFDNCENWDVNPDPEIFAERLVTLSGNVFLRAVFAVPQTMVDIEPGDTWMTAYGMDAEFLDMFAKLATAEGFFVWNPGE